MSKPVVDLFVMTYGADAEWFSYLARSYRKFASGFRDLVVGCPTNIALVEKTCANLGLRLFQFEHKHPGHMQQMVYKISADKFCREGADWICIVDSDCLFWRPTDASSLFVNDRPIFCYDDWEADHTYQWQAGTEAFMKIGPMLYNTMRRHGMCFRPSHLDGLRKHITNLWGDVESSILSCWDPETEWFPARGKEKRHWQPFGKPTFSEHCAMGWWCWKKHHRDFCWWNVRDFGWPGGDRHAFVKQYWSHYDIDSYRDELEKIVS